MFRKSSKDKKIQKINEFLKVLPESQLDQVLEALVYGRVSAVEKTKLVESTTETKIVESDKVTETTEKIQEATEKILDDGTYFVIPSNVIKCRTALKDNGLSEVSTVQKTGGKDYAIYPRKDKNGKTKIQTDEWNKKLQTCKDVMQYVKNGKPTSFNRGKRQYA